MINLSDANLALFNYIDSLLVDDASSDGERATGSAAGDNLCGDEGAAADKADVASGTDIILAFFFSAAGIPLAIPISGDPPVIEIDRASLRQIVSVQGLNIGMLNYDGHEYGVLDIKDVIFPNGNSCGGRAGMGETMRVLLLINAGCGIGCDEVGRIVELKRQDVEWCSYRKTRPWLSGMVKGHNRALLDVEEIIRMCAPTIKRAERLNCVN
jgi:hypothetical protein